MNKKQAEQEILRRLVLSSEEVPEITLSEYQIGLISKQELIRMITIDEDGNLLSEPISMYYTPEFGCQKYPQECYEGDLKAYQQALNQATEIVNCYDGE